MKTLARLIFLFCLPAIVWHAPLHAEVKAMIAKGAAVGAAAIDSVLTTPPAPTTSPTVTQEVTPVPREKGNITVYQSFNTKTGEIQYVGITNDLPRRQLEHNLLKGIKIREIEGLTDLTRPDAKSVEQTLIEIHGLEKNGGTLSNKINSIAKTNPKYAESIVRGAEILREIEYDGIEAFLE